MFIAMNRFKVRKGAEHDFEQVWLTRDSHLKAVPGFIAFHLLKGPERDDHVLYASHSLWRSEAAVSRLDPVGRVSQGACAARAPTSRSISAIPTSRASPSCKR